MVVKGNEQEQEKWQREGNRCQKLTRVKGTQEEKGIGYPCGIYTAEDGYSYFLHPLDSQWHFYISLLAREFYCSALNQVYGIQSITSSAMLTYFFLLWYTIQRR